MEMTELEKAFKALADKNRLRILKLLEQKPLCVCELKAVIKISQSTISKHLKKLVEAGFIEAAQDGLWTNYQLNKQNKYCRELSVGLAGWLNEDKGIVEDRKNLRKADRNIINS
jgi:ArsR family transcriptional regulator, arsenate/arsenite/antimonite-responsive transcriptional repressor